MFFVLVVIFESVRAETERISGDEANGREKG
jgi:hypothetical protein